MMDTDAIYLEVCNYGRSCRAKNVMDEADHIAKIVRLLEEADKEHRSLLDENERLVDEVQAARQEISEQARVNAMGAEREARLMARVYELEKSLRELHDATRLVSIGHYDQEAHDIAVSRALAALEKKHER